MRMSLKIFFLKETLSCPPLKITSISVAWTTTQIWTSLLLQNQPQTFSCDYWPLYFFWTWLPLGTMIKLQWFVMIKLQRHLLSSNVSPSWLFLGHLCGCCMCCRHVYSWLSVAPFASHESTSAPLLPVPASHREAWLLNPRCFRSPFRMPPPPALWFLEPEPLMSFLHTFIVSLSKKLWNCLFWSLWRVSYFYGLP